MRLLCAFISTIGTQLVYLFETLHMPFNLPDCLNYIHYRSLLDNLKLNFSSMQEMERSGCKTFDRKNLADALKTLGNPQKVYMELLPSIIFVDIIGCMRIVPMDFAKHSSIWQIPV